MAKFELWGITEHVFQEKIGGEFKTTESRRLLAEFSSKEKALEYVKRSKLKQPKRVSYGGDIVFRRTSLLRGCQHHEIEEVYDGEYYPPPFDPEI